MKSFKPTLNFYLFIARLSPRKTPAKPSAFSTRSSIERAEIPSPSLVSPKSVEKGYIFVPIPSLLPVSLAIATWSPT